MNTATCLSLSILLVCSSITTGCRSTSAHHKADDPSVEVTDVDVLGEPRAELDVPDPGEPALREEPGVLMMTAPVMALRPAASNVRYTFGQGDQGFVLWVSASGKLAALMRFEDSDGDGRIAPRFGQHGEALVDGPVPYLVDVYSGQLVRVAEILSWDSSSRYIAVRPDPDMAGFEVWDARTMRRTLIDESWGVELSGDQNVCLKPRQVHLSPGGMFWGIARGEQAVVGRSLDGSGQDVRIDFGESVRVWRIESAALDWLSVLYVPEDTDRSGALDLPVQNTSCACRFCARFAMSMGVYGWSGDAWRMKLASPSGVLSAPRDGFAQPLTAHVFVDAASEELLSWPGGQALGARLPKGCARAPWLMGEAPRVVLTCEDERTLLWEPTLEPMVRTLPVRVIAAYEQRVATSSAGTHWFGAIVKTAEDEIRAARVRMEDGLVELGEAVYAQVPSVRVDEAGIMEVTAQGASTFIEIDTGRRWRGEVAPDKRIVFSPRGAAMQVDEDASGAFVLPGGCVLAPSRQDASIEYGPWQVTCVEMKQTGKETG